MPVRRRLPRLVHALSGLTELGIAGNYTFEDLEFLKHFPALKQFIFEVQLEKHDFSPVFDLPELRLGRFISLRDFVATSQELQAQARARDRALKLEVLGGGRIRAATFELRATA